MTDPSRIDIDPVVVQTALVERLQTVLQLNDRNCYPVARAQDLPLLPVGGDYFLTVAFSDSQFPAGEQVPGNITEETEAVISIYTRIRTDSTSHDRNLLIDDKRGLYSIRNKVMAAVVGQDLLDEFGNSFLRQFLAVKNSTGGDILDSGQKGVLLGVMRVTVAVSYDVDLGVPSFNV